MNLEKEAKLCNKYQTSRILAMCVQSQCCHFLGLTKLVFVYCDWPEDIQRNFPIPTITGLCSSPPTAYSPRQGLIIPTPFPESIECEKQQNSNPNIERIRQPPDPTFRKQSRASQICTSKRKGGGEEEDEREEKGKRNNWRGKGIRKTGQLHVIRADCM